MRHKLLNSKAWLVAGTIALAVWISAPIMLARQKLDLHARGRFSETSWQRYEDYAYQVSHLAILFGSLSGFLAFTFIPDRFADKLRRQMLDQALRDRLKDAKPLSDEALLIIEEILNDET